MAASDPDDKSASKWQTMVETRLTQGLQRITCRFVSNYDYNVNAQLNTELSGIAGISVGGSFNEHTVIDQAYDVQFFTADEYRDSNKHKMGEEWGIEEVQQFLEELDLQHLKPAC